MIPLLSLLLAVVVLVKTSTKAVVVAGEEVLLLVEVVESPPPSKPKPRSPPSGAAETMHKTGRRLTKYILGEEELDSLNLAGSFSPTKFFRRQLRFISIKGPHQLCTCLTSGGMELSKPCQVFVRAQFLYFPRKNISRDLSNVCQGTGDSIWKPLATKVAYIFCQKRAVCALFVRFSP